MKNLKVKKSLILTMSAVGAMLLSSCDEGGGSKKFVSNIPQSTWKMQESNGVITSSGSINDANGVWMAIDKNDDSATHGKVNFIYENNTGQTAELVGCDQYRSDGTDDGSTIFDFKLGESIPTGASIMYRKAISPGEGLVAIPGENNMIAPVAEQLYKGSITSNREYKGDKDASSRDFTGICYYKIAVPNSDKYMYFGLNINSEIWRTYSAIFDSIDKPLTDLKNYQNRRVDEFMTSFSIPTPFVALGTLALASKTNPVYKKLELQHLEDALIQYQKDVFAEVNKQAAIMNSDAYTAEERAAARQKLFDKFHGDNSDQDLGKFQGSDEDLNKFLDDFSGIHRYTGEWTDTYDKTTSYKDYYVSYDKAGNPIKGQRMFDNVSKKGYGQVTEAQVPWDSDFEEVRPIVEKLLGEGKTVEDLLEPSIYVRPDIPGIKTPRALDRFAKASRKIKFNQTDLSKDPMYNSAIDRSAFSRSTAASMIDNDGRSIIDRAGIVEKIGLKSEVKVGEEAVLGGLSSTGVSFLVEVALWFSVMPVLNKIFDHGPVGQYNTGLMHGNLFIPSQDDVNKWNSRHSDKPIAYTTKMIANTDKDPTNSFRQQIGFTLIDGMVGEDKQVRYDVNMTYLTTPFLRITDSNGKSPEIDPYLQQSSEKSADGVFTLKIDAIKPHNDTRDLDNFAEGMLNNAGLSAWVPNYLPAPTIQATQVSQMSSDASNPTLNLSGLKSTKQLLNKRGLALMSVGDNIKGLFIAPNTIVNLGVSLDNNGGNKDLKTGTGFIANYISSGISAESTNPIYSVTGSQDEFNKLKSNLPLFYRAFTCEYPYKIGTTCNLSLAVSGNGNSGVDEGKLYLSDASGREVAIPVYLGYKLVAEPRSITGQVLNDGDGLIRTMNFANASSQRYSSINIDGTLPSEVKVVSNSCTGGLDPQQQCSIVYDFGAITRRVHTTLTYTGVVDGQEPTKADIKSIPFDVSVEDF